MKHSLRSRLFAFFLALVLLFTCIEYEQLGGNVAKAESSTPSNVRKQQLKQKFIATMLEMVGTDYGLGYASGGQTWRNNVLTTTGGSYANPTSLDCSALIASAFYKMGYTTSFSTSKTAWSSLKNGTSNASSGTAGLWGKTASGASSSNWANFDWNNFAKGIKENNITTIYLIPASSSGYLLTFKVNGTVKNTENNELMKDNFGKGENGAGSILMYLEDGDGTAQGDSWHIGTSLGWFDNNASDNRATQKTTVVNYLANLYGGKGVQGLTASELRTKLNGKHKIQVTRAYGDYTYRVGTSQTKINEALYTNYHANVWDVRSRWDITGEYDSSDTSYKYYGLWRIDALNPIVGVSVNNDPLAKVDVFSTVLDIEWEEFTFGELELQKKYETNAGNSLASGFTGANYSVSGATYRIYNTLISSSKPTSFSNMLAGYNLQTDANGKISTKWSQLTETEMNDLGFTGYDLFGLTSGYYFLWESSPSAGCKASPYLGIVKLNNQGVATLLGWYEVDWSVFSSRFTSTGTYQLPIGAVSSALISGGTSAQTYYGLTPVTQSTGNYANGTIISEEVVKGYFPMMPLITKKNATETIPLANAVFRLDYYPTATATKTASWYYKTDSAGQIRFQSLASGYTSSPLPVYKDAYVGNFMPIGYYHLTEIEAPEGYVKTDDVSIGQVTTAGSFQWLSGFAKTNASVIPNEDIPTNTTVRISKMKEGTTTPLSGAVIGLFVTEEDYAELEETYVSMGTIIEDEVTYTLLQEGTTDANGNLSFTDLPSGYCYYVKEIRSPEGYLRNDTLFVCDGTETPLITHEVTIPDTTIEILGTEASNDFDQINQQGIINTNATITLVDNVYLPEEFLNRINTLALSGYEGTSTELEYLVRGELIDVETGLSTGITASALIEEDSLITNGEYGVQISFTLDSTLYRGKTLVMYEYLYQREVGETEETLLFADADITNTEEMIFFPDLTTSLVGNGFGGNGFGGSQTTFTDTVSLSNLIVGNSYTLKGKLYDKNMETLSEVLGTTDFVATATDMEVVVTMICDTTTKKNHSVVAYEYLYDGENNLLLEETDVDNPLQTVVISDLPELPATGSRQGITLLLLSGLFFFLGIGADLVYINKKRRI